MLPPVTPGPCLGGSAPAPGAAALLSWKMGNGKWRPFLHASGGCCCPSWPEPRGLVHRASSPGLSRHPSPSPWPRSRGGGPPPRVRSSAKSTSVGSSPSLRGLTAGAVLLCSAPVGSTTAWPRPFWAQKKEGPVPWLPLLFPGLHQLQALPVCRLYSASLFPFVGPGLRGVSSSSHGPLLPSHTQVLGSAKQVEATEWPQRGLWSATST